MTDHRRARRILAAALGVVLVPVVAAGAASPHKVGVRATLLTQSNATTWKGAAVSPQLGEGTLTLTGKITFAPGPDGHLTKLRFRATFKKGWVSGCVKDDVVARPGNRYVHDGPGRITGSSAALRSYRGGKVYTGGVTATDDLTHIRALTIGTSFPGLPATTC